MDFLEALEEANRIASGSVRAVIYIYYYIRRRGPKLWFSVTRELPLDEPIHSYYGTVGYKRVIRADSYGNNSDMIKIISLVYPVIYKSG